MGWTHLESEMEPFVTSGPARLVNLDFGESVSVKLKAWSNSDQSHGFTDILL